MLHLFVQTAPRAVKVFDMLLFSQTMLFLDPSHLSGGNDDSRHLNLFLPLFVLLHTT